MNNKIIGSLLLFAVSTTIIGCREREFNMQDVNQWGKASARHWKPNLKASEIIDTNPHKETIAELYDRYNGLERDYIHELSDVDLLLHEGDRKFHKVYQEHNFFTDLRMTIRTDLSVIFKYIEEGETSALESISINWKPEEGSPKEAIQKNMGHVNEMTNFLVYAILLQEIQQVSDSSNQEEGSHIVSKIKADIHHKVLNKFFPEYKQQINSGLYSQFVEISKVRFLESINQ